MIVRIDRKITPQEVEYVNNGISFKELKYDYIVDENIVYVGEIISNNQIEILKNTGKTIMPYELYKKIPKEELLKEFKRIVGRECEINILPHELDDNTALISLKPKFEIVKTNESYFVYRYGKKIAKHFSDEYTNPRELVEEIMNTYKVKDWDVRVFYKYQRKGGQEKSNE